MTEPVVTWVGHATVLVELAGLRILTDPVLTDRLIHLRRVGGQVGPDVADRIDVVLVSHQHYDHLHLPSLRRIDRRASVVVPRGAGRLVGRLGFAAVHEVEPGDSVRFGEVEVVTVPAAHDDRRRPGSRPVRPVGYLVEAPGWACYFAGDTDLFTEMEDLHRSLDMALLPVWGWGPKLGHGHLDPDRAADALGLLGASAAVPIHWGTLWPYGIRRRHHRLMLPPAELATAVVRRGLDVEVLSTPPGSVVGPGRAALGG